MGIPSSGVPSARTETRYPAWSLVIRPSAVPSSMPPGHAALRFARWLPAICIGIGLFELVSTVVQLTVWHTAERAWISSGVISAVFLVGGVWQHFENRRTNLWNPSSTG